MTLGKSAARLYREYKNTGGQLSFNDWINREKAKFLSANGEQDSLLMIDRTLNDSVQSVIKDTTAANTAAPPTGTKTIFGINKTFFIISLVLVTTAGIYLITKHQKK